MQLACASAGQLMKARLHAGCAIGVNDMRNPLRPVLRALPFLPEVRSFYRPLSQPINAHAAEHAGLQGMELHPLWRWSMR